MSRMVVRHAKLRVGGREHEVASLACGGRSMTCEAVDVTALSDTVKRFVGGAVTEYDEFTATLYQTDGGDLAAGSAPETVVIEVALGDGEIEPSVMTIEFKALITKVAYPEQEATGDRKATYDVTFRPLGEAQGE